jgi:O-antigen/teichoic acid export membrane protein
LEPLAAQHIARNTFSLILREILGIVCLFLTNMILSRYLGLDGMGRIACYSSTFMVLLILAELGTPRALTILGAKSIGESTHITTFPRLLGFFSYRF